MSADSHRAFVGLGSNLVGPLGRSADYISAALSRLAEAEGVLNVRHSRLYRSAPWGNSDQADFTNAVAECRCAIPAEQLLDTLLGIEDSLGRRRGEKWGPRLIDLDLLTFDDLVWHSDRLTLPHPLMHQRAFVLQPLLELDPDFVIPEIGRADACLAALDVAQLAKSL